MIEISVSEAKASLSEYINRAAYGRERVVILSRGKRKAAIISADDLSQMEEWEEEHEAAMLAKAMETETRFHSIEEVKAALAIEDTASVPA
jgi:prevent-host-death family protein